MTNKEAIAVLQKIKPTPCRADGKSIIHTLETIALDMAIRALERDWIPVTERLPEADVDVLVTDNGGGVPTVIVDACGVKDDTGERFWYVSQTPVAWMEWPVPYKADKEV